MGNTLNLFGDRKQDEILGAWEDFSIILQNKFSELQDDSELENILSSNCGAEYKFGGKDKSESLLYGGSAKASGHADIRVKVIREVAKAIDKNFVKLSVNPDTGKFVDLVRELSAKLPDPDKNKNIKNNEKVKKLVCSSLVNILNSELKADISTSLPIDAQCEAAFGHIRLLLLGAGAEVFTLHAELRRLLFDMEMLRNLNKTTMESLQQKIDKSNDNAFKRNSKAEMEMLKELDNFTNATLRSVNHIIARDLNKDKKDVAHILQSSKSNEEAFKRLGFAKKDPKTAQQLGRAFREVAHLSIMVNKVAEALKKLNISVEQYKSSKSYSEFERIANKALENLDEEKYSKHFKLLSEIIKPSFEYKDKISNKIKGGANPKKEDYLEAVLPGGRDGAWDVLKAINAVGNLGNINIAYQADIVDKIEKTVEALKAADKDGKKPSAALSRYFTEIRDRFNVATNPYPKPLMRELITKLAWIKNLFAEPDPNYKSKYEKKLNKTKTVQGKIVEAFSKSLKYTVDEMIKNNKHIVADFRQEKIKMGQDTEDLFDSITQIRDLFSPTKAKYLNLSLIGYTNMADDKDTRERFIIALKYLRDTSNRIGSPALKKQASLVDEIIKTIDKYYDIMTKSRKTVSFSGVKEGGDNNNLDLLAGSDVVECVGNVAGGVDLKPDEYKDIDKVATKYSLLSSGLWELDQSLSEIKYYISIYKIRDNLKYSSKVIEKNSKNYQELVGKTVARKINEIQDEWEKTKKFNDSLQDHTNNGNASQTHKDAMKKLVDKFYKAKIDFYKVLESIESYLTAFSDGIIKNPDDIKNIENMLKEGEIEFDWYNKSAGDYILQTFETNYIAVNGLNADQKKAALTSKPIESGALKTQADGNVNGKVPYGAIDSLITAAAEGDTISATISSYRKSFDRLDVLKNLISTFVMIGKRFGGKKLEEASNIPFGEIYRKLCEFLSCTVVTPVKAAPPNPVDANNPFTTLGNANPAFYFSHFKFEFTTVNTLNNFWEEELDLFYHLINALSAKVFTVLGTYELLNRPYNIGQQLKDRANKYDTLTGQRRYDYVTRLVIGGNEYPEIIPEALELYVRLPLLIEFYKRILNYRNSADVHPPANFGSFEKIALVPDFENIWKDLINFYYFGTRGVDEGNLSDSEAKKLINIVNDIYRKYKSRSGQNITRTVLEDFVAEINSRIGIITKKDSDEFDKYVNQTLQTRDLELGDSAEVMDFKVIPDQDNRISGPGASSKYIDSMPFDLPEAKSKTKDFNVKKIMGPQSYHEIFEKFLQGIYYELKRPDLLNKVKYEQASISNRINWVKEELKEASNNKEKYDIVYGLFRSENQLDDISAIILSIFHEVIVAPFNTLLAAGHIISNFITKSNELYGAYVTAAAPPVVAVSEVHLINFINLLLSFNDLGGNMVSIELNEKFFRMDVSNLTNHIKDSLSNLKSLLNKFIGVLKSKEGKQQIDDYRDLFNNYEKEVVEKLINEKQSAAGFAEGIHYAIDCLEKVWLRLVGIGIDGRNCNHFFRYYCLSSVSAAGATGYNSLQFNDIVYQKNGWFNILDTSPGVVNQLNMLIANYLSDFREDIGGKIYYKLINDFANGTFSSAIYNGNNFLDVRNGATGANAAANVINSKIPDDSTKVIFHRTATIIGKLLNMMSNNRKFKTFLVESLADVPQYMRERYRTKLVMYENLFDSLLNKCHFIKKISEILKIKSNLKSAGQGNEYNKDGAWFTLGQVANPVIKSEKIKTNDTATADNAYIISMIDQVVLACRSILSCIKQVRAEVGELPDYLELYPGFSAGYKAAHGKEAAKLFSISTFVLSGKIAANRSTDPYKEFMIHDKNTSMDPSFKIQTGAVKLFDGNHKASLNAFSYLKKMIEGYNSYYKVNQKMDISSVDKMLDLNVSLLRYIHKLRYRNLEYSGIPNDAAGGGAAGGAYAGLGDLLNRKNYYIEMLSFTSACQGIGDPNAAAQWRQITICVNNDANIRWTNANAGRFRDASYFIKGNSNSQAPNIISLIESPHQATELKNIAEYIMSVNETKLGASKHGYSVRQDLRVINIFDMNIVPINIQALRREIAFTSLFTYAWAFDASVKRLLRSEFGERDETEFKNESTILHKLLAQPFTNEKFDRNLIYNIIYGRTDMELGRPKFLAEEFWVKSITGTDKEEEIDKIDSKKYPKPFRKSILHSVDVYRYLLDDNAIDDALTLINNYRTTGASKTIDNLKTISKFLGNPLLSRTPPITIANDNDIITNTKLALNKANSMIDKDAELTPLVTQPDAAFNGPNTATTIINGLNAARVAYNNALATAVNVPNNVVAALQPLAGLPNNPVGTAVPAAITAQVLFNAAIEIANAVIAAQNSHLANNNDILNAVGVNAAANNTHNDVNNANAILVHNNYQPLYNYLAYLIAPSGAAVSLIANQNIATGAGGDANFIAAIDGIIELKNYAKQKVSNNGLRIINLRDNRFIDNGKPLKKLYDERVNVKAKLKSFGTNISEDFSGAPRFDTILGRTVFYLVNLQRVLRLQMRKDLYWSMGPVVDQLPSISPDVTEISNARQSYKPERRDD